MIYSKIARAILASILLGLCSTANAFRSTDFESYTDPDYKGYVPKKIILLVANTSNEMRVDIEKRLKEAFKKKGIVLVSYRDLFPPTRTWRKDEQATIYEREQVDSGLIVAAGASSSSVIPVATQTYGTTNVFGSYGSAGTFNATTSSNSTSYNLTAHKSTAEFSAVLLDIKANRAVWYVDITTKAGGALFVNSKGDAKGLVKGVMNGLEKDNHLTKR